MQSIQVQMLELAARVAALESVLPRTANLAERNGERNENEAIPCWVTLRMRQAGVQLQASLLSAIHRAAQRKMTSQDQDGDGLGQLAAEILDEWCGPPVPDRVPPRLHWSVIVEHLGLLAERYAPGSTLHDAAFELCRSLLHRAQEQSKLPK